MKRCDPSAAYLFEENSITGDFLRTLREGEENALASTSSRATRGIFTRTALTRSTAACGVQAVTSKI